MCDFLKSLSARRGKGEQERHHAGTVHVGITWLCTDCRVRSCLSDCVPGDVKSDKKYSKIIFLSGRFYTHWGCLLSGLKRVWQRRLKSSWKHLVPGSMLVYASRTFPAKGFFFFFFREHWARRVRPACRLKQPGAATVQLLDSGESASRQNRVRLVQPYLPSGQAMPGTGDRRTTKR